MELLTKLSKRKCHLSWVSLLYKGMYYVEKYGNGNCREKEKHVKSHEGF